MLREVGFIAIVVNVTSEQPNVPFINGKTERGVLGLEFPSQSRLTATWKSHYQVKRCHRISDPGSSKLKVPDALDFEKNQAFRAFVVFELKTIEIFAEPA